MGIESEPKLDNNSEISAPESERESKVLSFDAIKEVIISKIGSKAEIKRLDIEEAPEGARLSAEIDTGMLGGQISIEGLIVNGSDGIAIRDLDINARGYVKSRIESNLSGFMPAIKKYFENQYNKEVLSIQIAGPSLIIGLGASKENDSGENIDKGEIESILEIIGKEKGWERMGTIDAYARKFIKQKRFDDARKVVGLMQNEEGKNKTLANIDKIEKNPDLKF